ncbi:probable 28S ribosomal protein S16, mitochondrial [Drosophila mojavensis]|uniref:Small ribosomal subunit protein bS16m n=1 Tax=Drosophila arizonae TaxID=7263 RepID=A0ABM1PHL7_DROAR|nr:probable 28S ribosomal protein S16, mitochondrial [Drosophila mojavensis]XP_017866703.1 PREDICTED: probable 28S ribosomal protein S16, mitochondrial isoform X2 [Drosophila arizonae]
MSLSPASGIGRFYKHSAKIIRFVRHGCANRPFYHIVVMERRKNQHQPVIEQVGSYDPLPNATNERLVALNTERIRYWLGKGAHMSDPAAELLGIAGLLPVHPRTYMNAWRNRKAAAEAAAAEAAKPAETA